MSGAATPEAAATAAAAASPANPPATTGGCRMARELVVLNVGGTLFTTTRTTLTTHGESMLAAMFRGDMADSKLTDAAGNPFIDRNPKHFPSILAYLRDGYVPLPDNRRELLELQAEAKYFALAEFADLLEEVIQEEEREQAAAQARKEASEDASALVAREHAAALTDATTKLGAAQTALQTASDHVTALQMAEREARQQWRALHEARVAPEFAGRPAQERRQNAEQLNGLAEQIQQLRGQLEGARLAREQAQRVVDHARSYKLACLGIHPPEPLPVAAEAAEAAHRRLVREGERQGEAERAEGLARRLWRREMEDQMRRARAVPQPQPPQGLVPEVPLFPWGWQPPRPPGAAPHAGGAPAAAPPPGAAPPGAPPPGGGQQRQQQAAGQRQAARQQQAAGPPQAAGPAALVPAQPPGADVLAAFAPFAAFGAAGAAQGGQPVAAGRRGRQEDAQAAARARPRARRRGDQDAAAAAAQQAQQAEQQHLHFLLAQLAGPAEEQEEDGDDVQVIEER